MARQRNRSLEARDDRVGLAFLAPSLLVFALIIAFPVVFSITMSFFRWRPTEVASPFVGFTNYLKVFGNPSFLVSLRNTFIYAFGGAFFKVLIGLGLALLLNQKFKGRGLARTLLMLPWIIPITASLTSWNWMLDGMYGVVNIILMRLGLITESVNFLGQKGTALFCVMTAGIWLGYPQIMVMLLAGLQAITAEQYEAAKVEGAGTWQVFFRITLPSLSGVMKTAIILSVIWTFNAFNVIWLLTRGGPSSSTHVMNTLAYELSFVNMRYDQGAALSVTILVLLAVFLFIYTRMQRSEEAQ
jgi:multiple sugar transport system permease protein